MQFIRKLAAVPALSILISISACQTQQGPWVANPATPERPRQSTLPTPGSQMSPCRESGDCEAELFPGGNYNFSPYGAKNCVLPALIHTGEAVYPHGVNSTHQETVKIALIVSSKGEVLASTLFSATNRKFVSAAINMAGAMKFRPMVCDGKAFDSYVVVPMTFAPREERSWSNILFSL